MSFFRCAKDECTSRPLEYRERPSSSLLPLESDESEKPSAGPMPGRRPPGTNRRGKRAGGCCGCSSLSSFSVSNGRFRDGSLFALEEKRTSVDFSFEV